MTDSAVCEWIALRGTVVAEASSLNFWMGQTLNYCNWPEREHELICPVIVPEPRCQK